MNNNYNDDLLDERKPSNIVWLSIYEGMLCQRRATETDGFEKYTSVGKKTAGKESYIKQYNSIKGWLVGWESRDKETNEGQKYRVIRATFESVSGRQAIIETNIKSEFVSRFAMCAENMDFSKPIQIGAFRNKKGHTAITINQDDVKIEQKYSMEHPNGLPEWKKDEETGEYDSRDYWAFLYNILKTVVVRQGVLEAQQTLSNIKPPQIDETPEYSGDEFAPFDEPDAPVSDDDSSKIPF